MNAPDEKKSFPEQIHELRLQRLKAKKRTKLPRDLEREICRRVNRLGRGFASELEYPRDFVFSSADGSPDGRLPIDLFDTSVCYDEIAAVAVLKGPFGMVPLDENICMVDLAGKLLDSFRFDSCGECTFCRIGTMRMHEIVKRICTGNSCLEDIDTLEELAGHIRDASLCELGKNAANPVLDTLRFFKADYEEHIRDRVCRAGTCQNLSPEE